jgi:hypothetical protein
VDVTPGGPVPAVDHDPIQAGGARRLRVDELQASIPVVAGNDTMGTPIRWTVKKGAGPVDGFSDDGYGAALGRPDYVVVTTESPVPNPLYAKFMRDMSLQVCDQIVTADLARAMATDATLWPLAPAGSSATADQISKNASYLTLRFLGLRLDPTDPQIASLVALQAAALAASDPKLTPKQRDAEGWRAVCIALLQDPAFHID